MSAVPEAPWMKEIYQGIELCADRVVFGRVMELCPKARESEVMELMQFILRDMLIQVGKQFCQERAGRIQRLANASSQLIFVDRTR